MVSNVNGKISVIIVDNNEDSAMEVEKSLRTVPDFEIINRVYDGETAVRGIIDSKPDIVILELAIPIKDGITVLKELREETIEPKPIIIVLTVIRNEKYIKEALNLGAEYYILKPFDMGLLTKRVMQIYNSARAVPNHDSMKNLMVRSTGVNETKKHFICESIEASVKKELTHLEVPDHLCGYAYLQKAILEMVLSDQGTIPITKQLYPLIAEYYNTSPGKVERAIRNAINKAWKWGEPRKLMKYFAYTGKHKDIPPTNSEFIATIADKIRLNILF